jgi:hypothetical protein
MIRNKVIFTIHWRTTLVGCPLLYIQYIRSCLKTACTICNLGTRHAVVPRGLTWCGCQNEILMDGIGIADDKVQWIHATQ